MRYPPIPFDDGLLQSALEMKHCGLRWTPDIGQFVWDPRAVIQTPSPFPNRVYFILNLNRFLSIFRNIEAMKEDLVWLPTWHQAALLCRELDVAAPADLQPAPSEADLLIYMYRQIARKLGSSSSHGTGASENLWRDDSQQWVDEVIDTELGSLDDYPETVQRWIRCAYSEVAAAYLGWRRIQEQKDDKWLPPERCFDQDLLSELGHFYSDYQRPIKAVKTIRRTVHLLRAVDPKTDPNTREHLLQVLITGALNSQPKESILEKLTAPIENHLIS